MLPPKILFSGADRSISDGVLGVGLRPRIAEFSGERARRGHDLVAHQCDMLVAGAHHRGRGTDSTDNRARLVADGGADANHTRQEFLTVEGIAIATDGA